jgi:hypothetical protein
VSLDFKVSSGSPIRVLECLGRRMSPHWGLTVNINRSGWDSMCPGFDAPKDNTYALEQAASILDSREKPHHDEATFGFSGLPSPG